jgi:hypothetical protein
LRHLPPLSKAAILLAGFLALPRCAHSTPGTVDLSWNACAPVIASVDSVQQIRSISLYVSVLGHDEEHTGAGVELVYGNGSTLTVPDAWRFDAGGCLGTAERTYDLLAPAEVAATCPSFDPRPLLLQQFEVGFVRSNEPYPPTMMRIYLSNQQLTVNTRQTNPNQRYFLARILFYLSKAVDGTALNPGTGGGLETPMCYFLLSARFATASLSVVPFALGNRALSIRGSCDIQTPAIPTTWGQLKSQYRN